jgi:uncharacterized protein (TIGR03437 family)
VSPQQINFLVPEFLATGPAMVRVQSNGVTRAVGQMQVEATAPGLFTQNADGKGVPAAVIVRYASNGSSSSDPVYACGAAPGSCQPAPIDLGNADQVYLLLFGTGIRHNTALTAVSVTIGGTTVAVDYAGPQGEFAGLDQVNVQLPPTLRGRGTVDLQLTVDSKPANTVQLRFR